jgi:outer membrane immunogenic protein
MFWCVRSAALFFVALAISGVSFAGGLDRWNAPYIGANIGYAFADHGGDIKVFNPTGAAYPTGPLQYSVEPNGPFGGLQVGINRRMGQFFAGLEADYQATDMAGSSKTAFAPPVVFPFTYQASTSVDWFATVRGRLGFAADDAIVYVTGGWAFGAVDYSATYLITQNNAFANLRGSDTQIGYVVGAGFERALGAHWSLKLEYQFINFGDQTAEGALFFANGAPSGETVKTRFDTEFHTVRIGLNYSFGVTP